MSNRALAPGTPDTDDPMPGPGVQRLVPLLVLGVSVLFTGCTRVVFTERVGKPVPASEADELEGEWIGQKGTIWRVEHDPDSGHLIARWEEEGKPQSRSIVVTTVGEGVSIVWAEETDVGAYLPLRISPGAGQPDHIDSLTLLYPSEDVVKKLVGDGKLAGVLNKEKNAWVISKGDWEALLDRPDFWRIDVSMPFVRNPAAKKTATAP
jgi:hypothetical protein